MIITANNHRLPFCPECRDFSTEPCANCNLEDRITMRKVDVVHIWSSHQSLQLCVKRRASSAKGTFFLTSAYYSTRGKYSYSAKQNFVASLQLLSRCDEVLRRRTLTLARKPVSPVTSPLTTHAISFGFCADRIQASRRNSPPPKTNPKYGPPRLSTHEAEAAFAREIHQLTRPSTEQTKPDTKQSCARPHRQTTLDRYLVEADDGRGL